MKLPKSLTTVTPLSKALALSLYVVVLALGFWLGSAYEVNRVPEVSPKGVISKQQAIDLIKQCKAVGTYTLHSGETGLILRGEIYQPVDAATEEFLRSNQNPICPFTKAAIE